MPIKKYQPTTPGRRGASTVANTDLTTTTPHKPLLKRYKKKAGRNNHGHVTVRHRGGGAKRRFRELDFRREKYDIPARVETIEYDPNRSARIALVVYTDGERRYILAPDKLTVGTSVISSAKAVPIEPGNRTAIHNIPTGIVVSNVELEPGRGGRIVRSAGAGAMVLTAEDSGVVQIKLPSGEIRRIPKDCKATIGQISNADKRNIRLGKAGRMRHRGVRPRVRGKAMNPVDHPHGGGEGRHPIGMKHPKTPWGKPALGVPTRRSKRSDHFIVQRRKKKK